MMRVFGIVGHPVEHTRSPVMMRAAFESRGVDAAYVPFDVKPGELREAVRGIRVLGVSGFNVTVPHKIDVMDMLDEIDEHAKLVGAVNTVWRHKDQLRGTNTDAHGFVAALIEGGCTVEGARVLVLGAGGAARAAVRGALVAKAASVVVAARRIEAAQELVRAFGERVKGVALNELATVFPKTDILVQATSATLHAKEGGALVESLPLERLPENCVVNDLVYVPRETPLLNAAKAHGLKTIDGTGMLVHQGAMAFEKWTSEPAPIGVMREALEKTL